MSGGASAAAGGVVIGVDLGGTKMVGGAVDAAGAVSGLTRDLTHAEEGAEAVLARLAALVGRVRASLQEGGAPPVAVSIGVPGGVDIAAGVVDRAPNLGWEGYPLAARLGERVGLPVLLDNDVRVAVLGEHAYGAGRGSHSMVGVWVGTGIGGGIVIDGRLYQGARGVAGEIGHMIVVEDGPRCSCGNRGCIEALASRTAIERALREEIRHGTRSGVLERMEKKGRAVLSSGVVAWAMERDDKAMRRVLRRAQEHLATFAANLVNALDPEVIVFGGGIAERLGEAFVAPIREGAREKLLSKRDIDRVRIVATELKDVAPIVGAAHLARERLAHPTSARQPIATAPLGAPATAGAAAVAGSSSSAGGGVAAASDGAPGAPAAGIAIVP